MEITITLRGDQVYQLCKLVDKINGEKGFDMNHFLRLGGSIDPHSAFLANSLLSASAEKLMAVAQDAVNYITVWG